MENQNLRRRRSLMPKKKKVVVRPLLTLLPSIIVVTLQLLLCCDGGRRHDVTLAGFTFPPPPLTSSSSFPSRFQNLRLRGRYYPEPRPTLRDGAVNTVDNNNRNNVVVNTNNNNTSSGGGSYGNDDVISISIHLPGNDERNPPSLPSAEDQFSPSSQQIPNTIATVSLPPSSAAGATTNAVPSSSLSERDRRQQQIIQMFFSSSSSPSTTSTTLASTPTSSAAASEASTSTTSTIPPIVHHTTNVASVMTTVTPSTGINNTPAEGLRKGRSSHEEVSLPTNASHFFPILTNVQNPQPSPIQPSEAMQRIVLPQLIPLLLRPPSLPTDREILSPSPAAQMPQQQVMASVVVLPDSEGGAGNDEHQQNGVEPSDSSSIAAVHPEQRREATMPSFSSSSESEEEYALRARHKRAVEVVENGTSSSSEKTVDNGTDAETTNTSTTANITNNVALWRVAGTRLSARLPSPFFAYSPYAPQQRAPPVLPSTSYNVRPSAGGGAGRRPTPPTDLEPFAPGPTGGRQQQQQQPAGGGLLQPPPPPSPEIPTCVNNCKGTKNALVRQKGSGVSGEKEKGGGPSTAEGGQNTENPGKPGGKKGKFDAHRYYYPPRQPLPLPSCFHNPTGYACCSPVLNDLIVQTYTELEQKPRFQTCNINAIATMIQRKAELKFNTSFESVAAFDDFAEKIHFRGDLVCKVELGGKYMLAYATVHDAIRKLPAEKDDPFIQNSYFEFAGMAPRPGGGGSGGGGGEGGPSGKGGPMVGGKRRRKREGREAMMLVGPRPEPPPPNHISQIHSILI